jgi:hypothetical protein
MASIRKEIVIDVGVEPAWAALRAVEAPHTLFAPVLSGAELQGDVRTVHFADGMVIRERILDVDEAHRRVAYAVVEPQGMSYHHASMQLDIAGPGRCVFIWITDFLPAEAAVALQPLIERGAAALKQNLEQAGVAPRASAARQS